MCMKRVVVTGLGCVTPLGNSVRESWVNLLGSKSGIIPITRLENYQSDYKVHSNSIPDTVTVGKVERFDSSDSENYQLFTSQDQRRLSRFAQFALKASHEALQDAGLVTKGIELNTDQINPERIGCAIGSGIASIEDVYDTTVQFHNFNKRINPLFVPKILTNMAAGNVSIKFQLKGPSHSVSTACATGNNAIGDAFNMIRLGMQDACLAGASEACVHPLSLAGFIRAKSINTTDGVSRPFDRNRSGFVLGEGAGIVVLESLEHAQKRGAKIFGEVCGYGLSSDAYHITSPSPGGDGAMRSMKMAIGNTPVSRIQYVNAHATSTLLGDRAECSAILNLLHSQPSDRSSPVYVSSNKGSMGHLLGAAGAVESIFTILSVYEQKIPHTLNLKEIGGAQGDLQKPFDELEFVTNEPKCGELQYALCNSFGFGGVNTSILFKKYED
ncbi:mitochondrial beta-keto-acyl synthase [Zygosaccharomyces mellis]|uniref:3-oxoacyl-[acyl-carrier-protein] synthase n=1 Tax=Zygosaccharomyces mellis TaxID=42258 RepID=A0A4C2E478_9SACH|nr:mitochondrial beta-keto-acyl synthase [Zygosaccharomyces mellis]